MEELARLADALGTNLADLLSTTDDDASTRTNHVCIAVFNVPLDSASNFLVGTLTATDPESNALSFSDNGNAYPFFLDSNGQLRLSDNSYLSVGQTYSFTASVYDTCGQDTATVTIHITAPVNQPSEFAQPTYSFNVPLDSASNFLVGTLSATDPENNSLTFSGGEEAYPFYLSSNGQLRLSDNSYLTVGQTYNFTATVYDTYGQDTVTVISVTVTVTAPINSAPVFGAGSYSFTVPRDVAVDSTIGTITATDVDLDMLTYSGQTGSAPFQVEANGTITVTNISGLQVGQTYTITVAASDGTATATANVTITIGAPLNAAPQFGSTSVVFLLPASPEANAAVGTVTATDAESDVLTYSSSNLPSAFHLDAATGAITVQTPSLLSSGRSYSFAVQADDLYSTSSVTVVVRTAAVEGEFSYDALLQEIADADQQFNDAVDALIAAQTAYDNAVAAGNQQAQAEYQAALVVAQQEWDAAIIAAQEEYAAQNVADNAVFNSEKSAIDAARDAQHAATETAHQQATAVTEAAYATAINDINAELQQGKDAAQAEYQSAFQDIEATRTASEEDAEDSYEQVVADANATLASGSADARATFTAADAAARSQWNTDKTATQTTLLVAKQANQTDFETALTNAGVTSFDSNAANGDPDFQAAVIAANQQFENALEGVSATYEDAVDAAGAAYDSTASSAAAAYAAAQQSAEATRQDLIDAAEETHTDALSDAASDYSDAASTALSTLNAAKTAAQNSLTAARNAAQSQWQSEYNAAKATFDADVARSQATYNSTSTTLNSGLSASSQTRWQAYSDALQAVADVYNGKVQALQKTYNDGALEADKALRRAENQAYDDLQDAQNQGWLGLYAKETLAKASLSAKYAWYYAEETLWYAFQPAENMEPFPESYKEDLLEEVKEFRDAEATAAKDLAERMKGPRIAAATADANAQYELAVKIGDLAHTLAIGTAEAALAFGNSAAALREAYLTAQANAEAPVDKALLDAQHSLDTDIAGWEYAFEYELIGASETLGTANAAAQNIYDNAIAAAECAYADALANAGKTQSDAIAAANEQLANDLAAAEVAYAGAMQSPYVTYGTTMNGAAVAYDLAVADAYVQAVTQAGAHYVQYVSSVEGAREAALSELYAADPLMLPVLTAYTQAKICDAMAEAAAATADAGLQRTYIALSDAAWLSAENSIVAMEAANSVAQAAAAAAWVAQTAASDRTAAVAVAAEALKADLKDNAETKKALVAEANENLSRTLTQITDDRAADEQALDDDLLAVLDILDSALKRDKLQVDNDLKQMLQNIKDECKAAKEAAKAEKEKAIKDADKVHDELPGKLDTERNAMIAAATKQILDSVKAAADHETAVHARPASYYEWELFEQMKSFDGMLDTTTNFFTGFANSMTFGVYMRVLGQSSYLARVDANSNAFAAGQLIGAVFQIAIGYGAGSGACQVGRIIQIARTYNTAGTWYGVTQATGKLLNEGWQGMSVFDWLALAPAAGKILGMANRMCFVAGTPVVVDDGSPQAVGSSSGATSDDAVSERGAWLAVGVMALWLNSALRDPTRPSSRRKQRRRSFASLIES